jgi:uncharacterized protein (TIGR02646 family)
VIKLQKLPEPPILKSNATRWTKVLVDKAAAGLVATPTEKTRYRLPEIKEAILAETHGKCAYCESRLLHIHHGDVEHIYPKSLDVTKTFEWKNLTLACEVCNQHKSNRDPLIENILDPYETDPEEHFVFLGALIFAKGTVVGESTRAILELHRAELAEMRKEQLDKVLGIYAVILRKDIPLPARQAIYQDMVEREASPKAEYAAMKRSLIKQMQSSLEQGIE